MKTIICLFTAGLFVVVSPNTEAAKKLPSLKTKVIHTVIKVLPKFAPPPKVDRRYDPRLREAAEKAELYVHKKSEGGCWHYVKAHLFRTGVVDSLPKTVNARDAGGELVGRYGFREISVKDPDHAPLGTVLVYGPPKPNPKNLGHVEIRTPHGFTSDFLSKWSHPSKNFRAYAKFATTPVIKLVTKR